MNPIATYQEAESQKDRFLGADSARGPLSTSVGWPPVGHLPQSGLAGVSLHRCGSGRGQVACHEHRTDIY